MSDLRSMGQGRLPLNRSPSRAAVPANAKANKQPRHDDRPRCGLPRLAVEWAAGFASAFQPTRLKESGRPDPRPPKGV